MLMDKAFLISLNYWSSDFLDGYQSIFTTTRKNNRDVEIGVTRNECKEGFSLFGFHLSLVALCVGAHQEFKRSGKLRFSQEFRQPLETSTTIILYKYNNLISVFKKDY